MKSLKFRNRLLAITGVAALNVLASCAHAQRPRPSASTDKPNVVFILADDLGWMDTSVTGSKFYRTPNIDKLRARGMMFTRAYTANPLCSPTRASILTGQYPGRLHLTAPQGNLVEERLEVSMPKNAGPSVKIVTAPSLTRLPLSYNTLGQSFKAAGYATGFMGKWHLGREPYVPENFGFDQVVGGGPFAGPPSFFSPYKMGKYLPDGPVGEHIDDRLGQEATAFIEANQSKPFYLNVWQYDVHAPFQAKPEYLEKYRKLVDKNNTQQSPTYAGMVQSMDDLVGTLTATLDRLKLTDKTMIVFTSDNGGNMYDRVDGVPPTSNAPARNGKGSIWDGGTRVPLIVSWPKHIQPNSASNELVSSVDFYPTLLDVAGARGKDGQIMDGVDLRPVLEGTGKLARDTIFCHFPHAIPATDTPASIYVHQGDWKLIRIFAGNPDQTDKFELYNLANDAGEANNLAQKMRVKVGQLNALISQHLRETGALVPFANPNYMGPGNDIDGWNAGGTATLERTEGGVKVNSVGGDPFLKVEDLPAARGPYSVKFRVRTGISGGGSVFWSVGKQGFAPTRHVEFALSNDNQWHEYEVKLSAPDNISNLRIDTGTDKGEAIFNWIRLFDNTGKLIKGWEFDNTPANE